MPTQIEITEHLGFSQKSVSQTMSKLDLDRTFATMDEIRLAYLNCLRAVAAGHISSEGLDLVAEKNKDLSCTAKA